MAKTYKSGDVVGTWETGHFESSFPNGQRWVPETYTWRIRFLADSKIWLLTASTTLGNWNGHEIVQSATSLNQWREHLDYDFLTGGYVSLLATDAKLKQVGLQNEEQLGDNFTQDNSTIMPSNGSNSVNTLTTQNTPVTTQTTTGFNTTYILIGAITIVLALILAKRK